MTVLVRSNPLFRGKYEPPLNIPPIITWVSPASGYTTPAPGAVPLSVTASDPDGPDPTVQFYRSDVPIGSPITSPPYTYTDTSIPVGVYAYTARATDVSGAFTTTVPVTVTIGQPQQGPTPSPDGTKSITITENDLTVWTFGTAYGSDFYTLRNGVWVGNGIGVLYLYFGGEVYKFSAFNSNWYRWTGSSWLSVGTADPSAGVVTPVQRIFAGGGQSVTDAQGNVWSFGPLEPNLAAPVYKNGTIAPLSGTLMVNQVWTFVSGQGIGADQILYYQGSMWFHKTIGSWHKDGLTAWGLNDPTGTEIFAQTVITPPAQVASGGLRASYTEAQLASGAGPVGLEYLTAEQALLPTYGLSNYYTSHTSEYRIFPQYPGVTFARQFSDQAPGIPSFTMCSWVKFFAGVTEKWVSRVIMIDPDLKDGLLENGVKLHGFTLEVPSCILFIRRSDRLTIPARYQLATYSFSVGMSTGVVEDIPGEYLYEGVFHTPELRMKLNTAGVPNGEVEVWNDDRQVALRTNLILTDNPAFRITSTELLLYQGGQTEFPARNTHIWIGPYTITTPAVGRAGMLRNVRPAWLAGAAVGDVVQVPGALYTDSLLSGEVGPGGSFAGITYLGGKLHAINEGGHAVHGTGRNAYHTNDLTQDSPGWTRPYDGAALDQIPPSEASAQAIGAHHYLDGTPSTTHHYYGLQAYANKLFWPFMVNWWASDARGWQGPGSFDLTTLRYDLQGSWSPGTRTQWLNGELTWIPASNAYEQFPWSPGPNGCCCTDPRNGNTYIGQVGSQWGLWRRTFATGHFDLMPNTLNASNKVLAGVGSFVDVGRNIIVFQSSGNADTGSFTFGTAMRYARYSLDTFDWLPTVDITGLGSEPNFGTYPKACHDNDNDKYLFMSGQGAGQGRVYEVTPATASATTAAGTVLIGVTQDIEPFLFGAFGYAPASHNLGGAWIMRKDGVPLDFLVRV